MIFGTVAFDSSLSTCVVLTYGLEALHSAAGCGSYQSEQIFGELSWGPPYDGVSQSYA